MLEEVDESVDFRRGLVVRASQTEPSKLMKEERQLHVVENRIAVWIDVGETAGVLCGVRDGGCGNRLSHRWTDPLTIF
jgi:hypothetical protein